MSEDLVRRHYGRPALEAAVLDALGRVGIDPERLRVDDLTGLDQLHAGAVPATDHVLGALGLTPATALLDIGSGVGGPSRLAASRYGCPVTGVDLSPHFVELARTLTERVGLGASVRFELASATALPFPDGSFARAMMNHVGMNLERKDVVFGEVRRVLERGGRFAVYDQMRAADGSLTWPMPWADDERSSFVERREHYAALLTKAGFDVEIDEDLTSVVAAAGAPQPGTLTPADLFGPGFLERILNNLAAMGAGILRPVLMVARAV